MAGKDTNVGASGVAEENVVVERGRDPLPPTGGKKGGRGQSKSSDALASLDGRTGHLEIAMGDVKDHVGMVEQNLQTLEDHVLEELESLKRAVGAQDELRERFTELFNSLQEQLDVVKVGVDEIRQDAAMCKRAIAGGAVVTPSPRVDTPKPKEFGGKRDAKELDNYIWHMEQYFEGASITDEKTKVRTATLYLTDTATLWWRRKHCDIEKGLYTIDTWEVFKREIKKQFYPENVAYEARKKMKELRHKGLISSCTHSGKAFPGKHSLSLISSLPKLIMQVAVDWKPRILKAFTEVFKNCNPESSLKLACLSAIEEMLVPKQGWLHLDTSDPEMLNYEITWIRELSSLLIVLGDKHPISSEAVLRLQLRLGQRAMLNSTFSQEYNNMQYSLREFYSTYIDESCVCYGPFMRLTKDVQELSVCCLYYFPSLDFPLLQSLLSCCLCHDLEPSLLLRIIEILHSAYRAGRIQIADHISFLLTLLSRYNVYPEKNVPMIEINCSSNFGTFKSITGCVCSWLSQIGDDSLVFQMLEDVVVHQIFLKAPVNNICALLRMLITVDAIPTRLSERSIITLANSLPEYLINVVSCVAEDHNDSTGFTVTNKRRYYLLPCLFLFYRSDKLLSLVLNVMGSLVGGYGSSNSACPQYATEQPSRISAIVSILLLMHADSKMQQRLLLNKEEIDRVLQNILVLQVISLSE
ncbi:hypothetical protein RJ639_008089, partial [Escallonia herrerae]